MAIAADPLSGSEPYFDVVVHRDRGSALEPDAVELTELRPRGSSKTYHATSTFTAKEEYIIREIQPNETLNSLSLIYSCPVSEIKRINGLIHEKEVFGLRYIKIPARANGILLEEEEQASTSRMNGFRSTLSNGDVENEFDFDDHDDGGDSDASSGENRPFMLRKVSIRGQLGHRSKEAQQFLEKMDKDLEKYRQTLTTRKESLSEVTKTLTDPRFYQLKDEKTNMFNGTDCGIRWRSAIIVMVLLLIIFPICYVIYLKVNTKDKG